MLKLLLIFPLSRSRRDKIAAFDEEIKQITKEMESEQRIVEYYQTQEKHQLMELENVEANYPNSKAMVSIWYF